MGKMNSSPKYSSVCLMHYFVVGIILLASRCLFASSLDFTSSYLGYITLLLVVCFYSFSWTREKFLMEELPLDKKAVFITGCDSGFGNLLAKQLDSKGFHVYAGCLFSSGSGAEELRSRCSDRLKIVQLNVTDNDSVRKAFEFVKNSLDDLKLWAIVNNAGIVAGLSADLSSVEDFKKCIDVNCLGTIRVTKSFLPLLKRSRGRIINVTSVAGRLSSTMKTPYSVSKAAAIGFTDSLRLELRVWGIKVISIEPHFFKTPITDEKILAARIDSVYESLEPEKRDRYGDAYFEEMKNQMLQRISYASTKIHLVLDAMESAISLKYPQSVYTVASSFLNVLIMDILTLSPRKLQDLFVKIFNKHSPNPLFLR